MTEAISWLFDQSRNMLVYCVMSDETFLSKLGHVLIGSE
jgi:hypothetical protein